MSKSSPGDYLRWLPWLFAAGAVFWLIELTQFAATMAAPAGRAQLVQSLSASGLTRNAAGMLVVESVVIVFLEASAIALHAASFYGLRKYRAWGWAAATVTSAAWSLAVVGIPVLVLLLRRRTREAYGVP